MANVLRDNRDGNVEWWLEVDVKGDILVRADAGTCAQTVAIIGSGGIRSVHLFNEELLEALGLDEPGDRLPYVGRVDDDEDDDEWGDFDADEEEEW